MLLNELLSNTPRIYVNLPPEGTEVRRSPRSIAQRLKQRSKKFGRRKYPPKNEYTPAFKYNQPDLSKRLPNKKADFGPKVVYR